MTSNRPLPKPSSQKIYLLRVAKRNPIPLFSFRLFLRKPAESSCLESPELRRNLFTYGFLLYFFQIDLPSTTQDGFSFFLVFGSSTPGPTSSDPRVVLLRSESRCPCSDGTPGQGWGLPLLTEVRLHRTSGCCFPSTVETEGHLFDFNSVFTLLSFYFLFFDLCKSCLFCSDRVDFGLCQKFSLTFTAINCGLGLKLGHRRPKI